MTEDIPATKDVSEAIEMLSQDLINTNKTILVVNDSLRIVAISQACLLRRIEAIEAKSNDAE